MRKRDFTLPSTTRTHAPRAARAARRARLARGAALLAGVVFSLALLRRATVGGRSGGVAVNTAATEKAAVAR